MFLRLFPVLLILISQNIRAYEFPIEIIEYLDNTKIVAFINESDIRKSIPWLPSKAPPPLTIEKLINVVREHLSSRSSITKAKVIEIELRQIPHHEDHWHYLVKMGTTVNNESIVRYFVVLMSGKVIRAQIKPESLI